MCCNWGPVARTSSPQDIAGAGPGVLGSLVSGDVLLFILGSPSCLAPEYSRLKPLWQA